MRQSIHRSYSFKGVGGLLTTKQISSSNAIRADHVGVLWVTVVTSKVASGVGGRVRRLVPGHGVNALACVWVRCRATERKSVIGCVESGSLRLDVDTLDVLASVLPLIFRVNADLTPTIISRCSAEPLADCVSISRCVALVVEPMAECKVSHLIFTRL